jgi:hypothetical protein
MYVMVVVRKVEKRIEKVGEEGLAFFEHKA